MEYFSSSQTLDFRAGRSSRILLLKFCSFIYYWAWEVPRLSRVRRSQISKENNGNIVLSSQRGSNLGGDGGLIGRRSALYGMVAAGGGGGPGHLCLRKCSCSSAGGLPCCCLAARLMLTVASYLKFAVLHPLWRRVRCTVVASKSSPSNPRFLYFSQLLRDYSKFCLMEGNWLDQLQYLFIYLSSSFVRPWYKIGSFLKRRNTCILIHSSQQKFNAFNEFVSLIWFQVL